jgi:hypothetical protein
LANEVGAVSPFFLYDHFVIVEENHTTIIMWIPIPPTTHKPNCGIAPKGGAI